MSLFLECCCVVHEDLWERRSWIMRVLLLPVWPIGLPIFYLMAILASKRP